MKTYRDRFYWYCFRKVNEESVKVTIMLLVKWFWWVLGRLLVWFFYVFFLSIYLFILVSHYSWVLIHYVFIFNVKLILHTHFF